jgi:hypothetical protein
MARVYPVGPPLLILESLMTPSLKSAPMPYIYPNPARDITGLKTAGKNEITGSMVIFDYLGREVKRDLNSVRGQRKVLISLSLQKDFIL